jgi:hypothetical protein
LTRTETLSFPDVLHSPEARAAQGTWEMVYESASTLPFFGLLGRKGRKMLWLSHGFPHGEWDPLAMCSVRPNPKNAADKNLAISGPLARPGRRFRGICKCL